MGKFQNIENFCCRCVFDFDASNQFFNTVALQDLFGFCRVFSLSIHQKHALPIGSVISPSKTQIPYMKLMPGIL